MIYTTIRTSVLLVGVMTMAAAAGGAQQVRHHWVPEASSTDLAVTYTLERAKIAGTSCGCFWLNGGGVDGSLTLFHGFGIAANITGEHASNIAPGVNLGKVFFAAGPRFMMKVPTKHATRIFGEALFGGVHAFDGAFPGASSATPSANSFALQIGGGIDVGLAKGFGLRLPEIDYVRSTLPNSGSNSQNDLRLAFGLSYHIGKR
jgi:hypothetical protein